MAVIGSGQIREEILRIVNDPGSAAEADVVRSLRYLDDLSGELPDPQSRQQLLDEFLRALSADDTVEGAPMRVLPGVLE